MNRRIGRFTRNFLAVSLLVMACSFFLVPQYIPLKASGKNFFHLTLNGTEVGTTDSEESAWACLREARRQISRTSDEMLFIDAQLEMVGEEVVFGRIDDEKDIVASMKKVLSDHELLALTHCYTVKIGAYTINLKSEEDIRSLLNEVLSMYDDSKDYVVSIVPDPEREVAVFTSEVLTSAQQEIREKRQTRLPIAGIEAQFSEIFDMVTPDTALRFEDYKLGLQSIGFGERIEIAEAYMPQNQISGMQEAIEDVTGNVARSKVYEVKDGDTLYGIASGAGISLEELIRINPILTDENSLIRRGDNLNIMVAEPKLTVVYTTQEFYEEDYEAETIYKNNDSWYTNRSEVIQEPTTGHRKVVALVHYRDGVRESSDIIRQETSVEAVPKIIERGTVTPPTYIWPVSGGYITSGFGYRSRPKAGASTYHQGTDIGLPTGTAVMASCGGKVIQAGWQSGYGYVIYLQHPDGVTTRYGHLSRILVRTGQSVRQGDRIALSGNTGNSTGPHLHFEVRVNGQAVNPVSYVNSH